PISRGRPQGRQISTGALAFSQGIEGTLGNAAHDYKRSGIPFQPRKRGAAIALSAPLSPSQASPHPEGEDQQLKRWNCVQVRTARVTWRTRKSPSAELGLKSKRRRKMSKRKI